MPRPRPEFVGPVQYVSQATVKTHVDRVGARPATRGMTPQRLKIHPGSDAENGLPRAVGLTRGQSRGPLACEALLVSIGAAATAAGILASVLPARLAARTSPVAAIAG